MDLSYSLIEFKNTRKVKENNFSINKKAIRTLPIILFLLSNLCLIGQVQHELKIEALNAALNKNYILSYEMMLSKKVGIEIATGFDLLGNTLTNANFVRYEFEERRFNPSIGGKYY